MMQAILIDPFTETVEEIEYSGDWKDISALLDCSLFTCVYFDMNEDVEYDDTLYVDDEGMYVENQRFFKIAGYPQPLAGKGLVLGSTEDGDSTDCVSSLEDIRNMVYFLPKGFSVMPETFVVF